MIPEFTRIPSEAVQPPTIIDASDPNPLLFESLPPVAREEDWRALSWVLSKHFHNPDLGAVRALYSAFVAHRFKGTPVWTMLIAEPGSMKSELLGALDQWDDIHSVDGFTAKTFISGRIEDRQSQGKMEASPSLLRRIGRNGVIICKDFSTVLAGKAETRESIFADLRKIYDGELAKEYGTGENLEEHKWRGRISIFVGVTPAVDRYTAVFQSLGDRFLLIRAPRAEGPDAALVAMNQDSTRMRLDINASVALLMDNLPDFTPSVPRRIERQIATLSEIIARGRAQVTRDARKEIIDIPQIEAPTRPAQQLKQLARGSALISHRAEVHDSDYRLIQRVALDCLRPARRQVLEPLLRDQPSPCGLPGSTRTYALEELEAAGLVVMKRNHSELTPEALKWATEAGFRDPVN